MGFFDKFKKTHNSNIGEKIIENPIEQDCLETKAAVENSTIDPQNEQSNSLNFHPQYGYRCESCGLYPVEILMIAYSSNYSENQIQFPGFWKYSYNQQSPEELLKRDLELGFIQLASPKDSLSSLKVDELKSI